MFVNKYNVFIGAKVKNLDGDRGIITKILTHENIKTCDVIWSEGRAVGGNYNLLYEQLVFDLKYLRKCKLKKILK